jgi:hypothetical protein
MTHSKVEFDLREMPGLSSRVYRNLPFFENFHPCTQHSFLVLRLDLTHHPHCPNFRVAAKSYSPTSQFDCEGLTHTAIGQHVRLGWALSTVIWVRWPEGISLRGFHFFGSLIPTSLWTRLGLWWTQHIHTYIHTYIQTLVPFTFLSEAS